MAGDGGRSCPDTLFFGEKFVCRLAESMPDRAGRLNRIALRMPQLHAGGHDYYSNHLTFFEETVPRDRRRGGEDS